MVNFMACPEARGIRGKGYTLIELMIVIAVIGILAAVAIPQLIAYRERAFNSQAVSDAKNFYSSSVLASGQSTVDRIYSAAELPSGYHGAPPISGSFTYVALNGGILCDTAFRHPQGSKTYTLDNNGNIAISD